MLLYTAVVSDKPEMCKPTRLLLSNSCFGFTPSVTLQSERIRAFQVMYPL